MTLHRPSGSAYCLKNLMGGAAALLLALPDHGQSNPPDQDAEWLSRIKADPGLTVDVPMKELAARTMDSLWLTRHRENTLGYVGGEFQRVRIRFLTIIRERKSPPAFGLQLGGLSDSIFRESG